MDNRKENYSVIFKTTFLFGFVQVARLLLTVIKNKVVAMLLGPQGVGIISIYNNAIDLIRTGSGLGISQSAVKDISEAKATGDRIEFSTTISVIKKVVYFIFKMPHSFHYMHMVTNPVFIAHHHFSVNKNQCSLAIYI